MLAFLADIQSADLDDMKWVVGFPWLVFLAECTNGYAIFN